MKNSSTAGFVAYLQSQPTFHVNTAGDSHVSSSSLNLGLNLDGAIGIGNGRIHSPSTSVSGGSDGEEEEEEEEGESSATGGLVGVGRGRNGGTRGAERRLLLGGSGSGSGSNTTTGVGSRRDGSWRMKEGQYQRSSALTSGSGSGSGIGLGGREPGKLKEKVLPRNMLDVLPLDVWLHIVKFLSTPDLKRCVTVCRLFASIAVENLWSKPTFRTYRDFCTFLNVLDPGPQLAPDEFKNLSLQTTSLGDEDSEDEDEDEDQEPDRLGLNRSGPESMLVPGIVPLRVPTKIDRPTYPYASYVRRINLSNFLADVTDDTLFRLRGCSRLDRLTLTGCSLLGDSMVGMVLGLKLNALVALDLSMVKNIGDAALRGIAMGCLKLQGLNLNGCNKVTDVGVTAIAQNCRSLRRIKLVKCTKVTDASVVLLARNCFLLLEVDLDENPNITAVSIREFWLCCLHLRELRLASCPKITDAGFPYLSPPLSISASSPSVLDRPFRLSTIEYPPRSLHPPTPRPIYPDETVYGAYSYETASFEVVPPPGPRIMFGIQPPPHWLKPFDHLRVLDLTSCASITDAAVDAIVTNAPMLRSLVLAKCPELTDQSLFSICTLGRSLHQLHMAHCFRITDAAVSRLARSCTRLRYVDFACCPELTDMSVIELSQLTKLRRIGLVRVAKLTDQAIHALVERPSSLERIHLSYCEEISVEAIYYLLRNLPRLTHLSLTGVPSFRKADLQRFRRPPPADFNSHQRAAFCVYSGDGVIALRNYLSTLYHVPPAPSPTSSAFSSLEDEPSPLPGQQNQLRSAS
ncbi:Leucine rich repeat proteins, some proteins contain F-box [Phaffia rhodozyma]|uniref:Leucine rich repeat proteins, some proteins contain F-box n=1 Tax=Phaffia rhodozyma TaxID=264483 RepID=A0A0F7SVS3_PHARH|nr:Leucine rich repeat proteins, some proteins contain F-box [Phaffia rhodozyma]